MKQIVSDFNPICESFLGIFLELFEQMGDYQIEWNEDIFEIFVNHYRNLEPKDLTAPHQALISAISDSGLNNKNFSMNFQLFKLINNYAYSGWFFFSDRRPFLEKLFHICDKNSRV